MLKINNLTIKKGSESILKNINLEFENGKIYGILGPNGVGKSSLLDAIYELDCRYDMQYKNISSKNIKEWQENIGYMLQNFHTHAQLSVLEVVLLGAYNKLNIKLNEQILEKALKLLDNFGILGLANHNIHKLSGGQKQMVAFAQVLIKEPKILLLDEPVSALDLKYQCILLQDLKDITKKQNIISLVVMHDLNLASLFCDEVIILYKSLVYKKGIFKNIVDRDLIRTIYDVDAEIIHSNNKSFIQVLQSLSGDNIN